MMKNQFKERHFHLATVTLLNLLATDNHQCSKYRNNLIEQDHRLIKHVLVKSSGVQSLRIALKTLSGI